MTSDSMAALRLEPACILRAFYDYKGNVTRQPESHYLDLIVDDVPFSSTVENADDLVTAMNRP